MYHLRYPETNLYRVLGSHLYTTTPAVDHESNPTSDERRRVKINRDMGHTATTTTRQQASKSLLPSLLRSFSCISTFKQSLERNYISRYRLLYGPSCD